MTEHRGLEAARYVTDTAILVGHDMTRVLANRATGTTIMTGVAALTHNFGTGMVDKGVSEIGGVVAHTTILVGLMNGRIRLRSGIERNEITIVT